MTLGGNLRIVFAVLFVLAWPSTRCGSGVGLTMGQRLAGDCNPAIVPFGKDEGDTIYSKAFDTSVQGFEAIAIDLPSPVSIMGAVPSDKGFINLQGIFSLGQKATTVPEALPFENNIPAIAINANGFKSTGVADGHLYHQLIKSSNAKIPAFTTILNNIWYDATDPLAEELEVQWVLIVTWACVHIAGMEDTARETFQFILMQTPGNTTFVVNNYDNFVDPNRDLGFGAQSDAGNAAWPPQAVTGDLLNRFSYGCPCGRWSFRVDPPQPESPGNLIDCSDPATACPSHEFQQPPACTPCNEDFQTQCQCQLYSPDDSPDPNVINVGSFLEDESADVSFPFPADVTGNWEFKLVNTDNKLDVCKFSIEATMRRTNAGEVFITILEIRYGFQSSSSFTQLLKIKDGRNLFVHPNRHRPTLPYTKQYPGNDNMNVTVIIEKRELNIFRVSSPECGWSIMYYADSLPDTKRALVVYTGPRPYRPDNQCGECNVNLVTTTAPPFNPTFINECQCSSRAPEVLNFYGAPVAWPTFSGNSRQFDLARHPEKTAICKFRISLTLRKENDVSFISQVSLRFGLHASNINEFDKLLRITNGEEMFLFPNRQRQIPVFMFENGNISVIADNEPPDALRIWSPECGWNFILRGKALPELEREAFVDVAVQRLTTASFCGDRCEPLSSPISTAGPPTNVFDGNCQCHLFIPTNAPTPTEPTLELYDGTTSAYTKSNAGDISKTADKNSPCKFRATVILGTDSATNNTFLGVGEVRFGYKPTQPSSFAKLLKIKSGTKAILRPDGIELTLPFNITIEGVTVHIEDHSHDAFKIHSPQCGWAVFFFAKTRDAIRREYYVDTTFANLEGRCGVCVDPDISTPL